MISCRLSIYFPVYAHKNIIPQSNVTLDLTVNKGTSITVTHILKRRLTFTHAGWRWIFLGGVSVAAPWASSAVPVPAFPMFSWATALPFFKVPGPVFVSTLTFPCSCIRHQIRHQENQVLKSKKQTNCCTRITLHSSKLIFRWME